MTMQSAKTQAAALRTLGHDLLDQRSRLRPYRSEASLEETQSHASFLLDGALACLNGAREIEELAGIADSPPYERRRRFARRLAWGGATSLLLLLGAVTLGDERPSPTDSHWIARASEQLSDSGDALPQEREWTTVSVDELVHREKPHAGR